MASSLANKIVSKVMSGDSRYSITFNLNHFNKCCALLN